MKTFATAAALALAATLPIVASAQSTTSQVNGLYFEAKINFARTKFTDTTGAQYRFQDQGLGLGIGYNIDPTFAVEAGYDSLGKDQGIKLRGAYLGGVISYQLTPELVGKLKAGALRVQAKDDASGAKDSRTRLYLGAGLEYPVAPQLSVTGDYRYTRIDGEALHTLSAGAKYTF